MSPTALSTPLLSTFPAQPEPQPLEENRQPCACGQRSPFLIKDEPKGIRQKIWVCLQLCLICLPWCAESLNWQAQFNVRTPYLERYGVDSFWTSIIWLSGPISGLVVSPIVGYLSDTTTSTYGPRRPWILFGLVLLGVADICLASGDDVYNSISAAVINALFMFVLSDVAVNVIQTPLRALNSDVSPASMQFAVQLFLVVFQGLGQLLAFQIQAVLGKQEYFTFFVVVYGLSVVMTLPVCLFVTEQRLQRPKQDRVNICEPIRDMVRSATYVDAQMMKLGMVNVFSWFALFAFLPLGSTYMAVSVYGGCPSVDIEGCSPAGVERYHEGILDYANTGVIGNVVQILCAVVLSLWMFKSPSCKLVKAVYALGLFVGAVTGAVAKLFPGSPAVGQFVIIVMNVPNTIMRAFPFAILAHYENGSDGVSIATKFGVLNLFIVLPQIAVTFVVSSIRSALGDEEGLPWVMVLAGFSFFLGSLSCYFVESYDSAEMLPREDSSTCIASIGASAWRACACDDHFKHEATEEAGLGRDDIEQR